MAKKTPTMLETATIKPIICDSALLIDDQIMELYNMKMLIPESCCDIFTIIPAKVRMWKGSLNKF